MQQSLGPLSGFLADLLIPEGLVVPGELPGFLDAIHVVDFTVSTGDPTFRSTIVLAIPGEVSIGLLGMDGARLVVGEQTADFTFLTVSVERDPDLAIVLHDLRLAIRFGSDAVGGSGRPSELVFQGTIRLGADISLTATDVVVTGDVEGILDPADRIEVIGFHLSTHALALRWSEPNVNRWLSKLSPDLADEAPPAESDLSVRVLFGSPIQEVRLDWTVAGVGRTLKVPGFKIATPDNAQLTVMFGGAGRTLGQTALALTFAEHTSIVASSAFAWERETGTADETAREIHDDPSRAPDDPLLKLTLAAEKRVSLALLDFNLGQAKLPKFLKQFQTPLSPLDFTEPASLAIPTPVDLRSITDDGTWTATFDVNLARAPFTLPFLGGGQGDEQQLIQLDPARPTAIHADLLHHSVDVSVGILVAIGPLRLSTAVDLLFDWETFAFRVKHDEGLQLYSDQPEIAPAEEHLGLRWKFTGARVPAVSPARYHFLTLATKNHDYRLQQPPGASVEVVYTQLSEDGIGFAISNFALTSSGISLTATVLDRPAKLNGIDTRFRFQDSSITIVENAIADFTLKGTGPLPPALVGDATADIALQMAKRDGKLTLVSGGAQLKGSKLLDCKGTRFQFSIDAIGVKFVYRERFHLYFTLTGSAQFKLAAGDDAQGALALLPNIRIDLVETPLAGDAREIAKHVNFLVELPKPLSFSFLGAFEMELRGIGFVPQAEVFDGDGAMIVTGQLKFAQGAGDAPDSRTDLHKLYIGLPKPGGIFPRIHFANLPVLLNFGSAFQLNGVVDFVDGALEKGFSGEGTLTIQGLPTMAAAFAFLRVRRDEAAPWVRAWFVYIEARKISFQIPVVNLYLREVGLGFGYRFTLVSLRAADEANDVRKLLTELTKLSRTQGDLSKRDRWALDLEPEGQDPRWTIALRAMISQTSGQASPLRYSEESEKNLACLFLLDAVIALRSDLTFLMAIRGWLFANYNDYVIDSPKGLRGKPVVSGFVLLSPRHKRLLAHAASNPDGLLGNRPPLPPFVQRALSKSQFSTTLLVEPGLLHTEMGWPNQLRWADKYGPLDAEFRGGFLFRVSRDELVTGTSFLARARLKIGADVSLGVVGCKVSADASVAFGARYIGLVSLRDPLNASALYGGIGLEALIKFAVEFWIRLKLGFVKITKTFRFSFTLEFTAGLEIGFVGISTSGVGLRGTGHLAVSVMGRRFSLSARLGANEGAVATALERTKHVLSLGLEAADVEAIPGTAGTGTGAPARLAAAASDVAPAARRLAAASDVAVQVPLAVPGYSLFVIRRANPADANEPSYFVLFPAGETAEGAGEEPGFLPPPPPEPAQGTASPAITDFTLGFPDGIGAGVTLEQWISTDGQGSWVPRSGASFTWTADWDAPMEDPPKDADGNVAKDEDGNPAPAFTLRRWLDNTFVVDEPDENTRLYRDPEVVGVPEDVEDERVRNPTDAAFEAAVRGAMEQFRGSPFFRRDPASEYEQLLERAYRDDTTVYHPSGLVPQGEAASEELQKQQQAHEARGLVVHDMIADLRDHVAAVRAGGAGATARSVAFASGLVFRVRGNPAWLDGGAGAPNLAQRRTPGATKADTAEPGQVRTFNVPATDFAANPPRFERIQQLTDARTIALAWDLVWSEAPAGLSPAQADPEQHLVHYAVRRRALDGNDREVVFTVKGADTLHREQPDPETGAPGLLARLRRRFQLVDHFAEETLQDLASIPVTGKRYLYSITPVDFAGNSGRPLSLVATRYPSEPPQVPVDAECVVHYALDAATLAPTTAEQAPIAPAIVQPAAVTVEWSDPTPPPDAPSVPTATYQLVFRRDPTLPIGSYGLDSTTQRPPAKVLPTTNARALPTDVKVVLSPQGPGSDRRAKLTPAQLQAAGILPADGAYRPESWRVFFQTVSQNGVPSALAPVQLLLRAVAASAQTYDPLAEPPPDAREERRPAELEWLARPARLPMLPPEDQAATVGPAHAPMPAEQADPLAFAFSGGLEAVGRALHPAGLRCIRFRWNQGPSERADYPLELNAGYHLLQLDVDAHATPTFSSGEAIAKAVRTLQEVQMIPADELLLTPGDTLAPTQWEAWYPSAVQRGPAAAERTVGSDAARRPWYSWRESVLEWPEWTGLTDGAGLRDGAFHPALDRLLALLSDPPEKKGLTAFRVEVQAGPPTQPEDLAAFLKSTAPASDPYGWGVLQRFGLSVALRLRTLDTGDVVAGQALLDALANVFAYALATQGTASEETELLAARRHLLVELLFQPGRAFALDPGGVDPSDLLALAQVSLRPAVAQTRKYARVALEAKPGTTVGVGVFLAQGESCSVFDAGDPSTGQADLSADAKDARFARRVRIPLGARTALLLRLGAERLPQVSIALTRAPRDAAALAKLLAPHTLVPDLPGRVDLTPFVPPLGSDRRDAIAAALDPADAELAAALAAVTIERFDPTDDAAASFVVSPAALAADLSAGTAQASWSRLARYLEALSSTDPDVPPEQRLRVPATREDLEKLAPDLAAWSQRFFDASGPMAPAAGDPVLHATAQGGPWIATAYPRAGSPAHAAPDASGRLTYDQLVEDPWAHAYRFYVRPYGRYDLLWQSLRQSTVLFSRSGSGMLADAQPDPDVGGLDVVLDRTRPVAKPLVLSSARLDAPSSPASPAPPGPTWEVILAEHPEQALVDHNQTLARQLAFRQVSYALLRGFAYPRWVEQLSDLVDAPIDLDPVRDVYPGLPGAYPAAPEHLALPPPPLAAADARTLDLPARIGPFQQGALALQWEGLPFFYEHRLLAVAQTTATVSPVNEVVQRDFDYVTPAPIADVQAIATTWRPQDLPPGDHGFDVRAREVHLTLRKLWDSLPAAARARWPAEAPDGVTRKPGWFPDLGVVYQLVEQFSGNVEVQAEVFWDEVAGAFARRQLGNRFLADVGALGAPDGAGDFSLAVVLQQVTRQELSRAYDPAALALPAATRSKASLDGKVLAFVGVMTHADRDALLAALDPADGDAIRAMHDAWYAEEFTSVAPAIPAGLADVLDLPVPADTRLVWDANGTPMTDAERAALLALPGDDEFVDAAARLAAAARTTTAVVSVSAPLGPEQLPAALVHRVALPVDPATGRYVELRFGRVDAASPTGNMSDDDVAALVAWPQVRALREAVSAVVQAANAEAYVVPLPAVPAPSPWPEDLPPALAGRLGIDLALLRWAKPAPSDAERAALAALAGDDAFEATLAALLAAIDAERTVPLGPVVARPSGATLPAVLRGRLLVGPTSLAWDGDPPTTEERAALAALSGDRAFLDARGRLLAALDAGSSGPVDMAPFVPRPASSELPAPLQGRLVLGDGTLRWTSPAPTDAERAALASLAADDATMDALPALWPAIDADRSAPMTPRRPRQDDLPAWIADQLTIEPERVTFVGRLHDASWRDFLAALPGAPADPDFAAAVQQILGAIDAQVLAVPFTVPARPAADALGALETRLLVGRAVLRYHGLMTAPELRDAAALFERDTDRRAVRRLYDRTQSSGMRGRELMVRTRRGTAPPSALTSLPTKAP